MTALRGFAARCRPWTRTEDAAIRERYGVDGAKKLAAALGRTEKAVWKRARRLGMKNSPRWSAEDDQQLAALWGTMSVGQVAKQLKRTPTTTYWRARKLGLGCGATQGLEYLTSAADRTGYCTSQLRHILRWAGVRVIPTASRPSGRRRHYHMVDPLEVDEALERWHATEPIETAARSRGLVGETLRRWLRYAGVDEQLLRKGYKRHSNSRVESEVIDRVIAERSKLRTLSSEARRVNVNRVTLRKWLLAAGVPRAKRNWFVDPADVDRVVAERRRPCSQEAA